ncbi:LLM class flavin-dependent oxidoreductase [Phytoactinopolyspora alkaliphila]|uniref:LLM class flavin-dependent oxidoreductase n=1 Tax=Phytoactinopolyspora alkaliphila TaxID=1783498 RepID=A0A6N9YPQ1_9ACTN|nr:LLM class flavin-dependent oxidoreductase [Phytoactinopolyspora alkaliphila]NED97026.1 LLM class flavin-dependent oxidoreductase [Phytoactinopolyspora alkaliphila]
MTARITVALQSDKSPAEYAAAAQRVEELGFDGLSIYADLGFQPPLPALLHAAAATTRLSLMPACLNPYLTHPVEIAGQHAALDAASGGRARLGIARGTWLSRLGITQSRPIPALRETILLTRALLGGDRSGFQGTVFQLEPGAGLAYAPLRQDVDVMLGTWGPKGARVAAEVAQEVKIGGTANAAMVRLMRTWLDDAGGTRVAVAAGAVTVVDEDGDRARALARREVAMYVDVVAGLDRSTQFDPDLMSRVHELVTRGEIDEAGRLLPLDVLKLFCLAGTPAEVAEHAVELAAAGADRIEFGTPHGLTGHGGIELLGTRVLPAVREALGIHHDAGAAQEVA